jgi:hypothetical protein
VDIATTLLFILLINQRIILPAFPEITLFSVALAG